MNSKKITKPKSKDSKLKKKFKKSYKKFIKKNNSQFESAIDYIKLKYSNSKKRISKFYKSFVEKHKDKISSIREFLLMIFGYGILVNIPAYTFFNSSFNLWTIFSLGIISYFIKDEFVEWVRRIRTKR